MATDLTCPIDKLFLVPKALPVQELVKLVEEPPEEPILYCPACTRTEAQIRALGGDPEERIKLREGLKRRVEELRTSPW